MQTCERIINDVRKTVRRDAKDSLVHFEIIQAHKFYGFTNNEMPTQINGPWSFDIQAALRTLDLIFNVLHHNCYLLCVINCVYLRGQLLKDPINGSLKISF